MICSEVQEKLASGTPLSFEEQQHATGCAPCAAVAATYSLLDETLGSLEYDVPAGFADRVMVMVSAAEVTAPIRWFERPWAQVALAQAGAGFAIFNLLRFFGGILVPSIGLGGTP